MGHRDERRLPMPLCVKGQFLGVLGRVWVWPLALRPVVVLVLGLGPGSDLSEEPAFQDVEPVTLDLESFLIVLPGPLLMCGLPSGRLLRGGGR